MRTKTHAIGKCQTGKRGRSEYFERGGNGRSEKEGRRGEEFIYLGFKFYLFLTK